MGREIAWIILVNLILYFKTLRHKFVSDDFSVHQNPPKFKNWWHKQWLRFTGQGKWASKSLAFFKQEGKWKFATIPTAELEHLLALVIHICICVAIYFAFGMSKMSFIASLLYSANPANNQATIWPGGRGYALPILSLLLSMAIPILSPVLIPFCQWYTIGFLAPLVFIGSTKWWLLGPALIGWALSGRKYTTAIRLKAKFESYTHDKTYDWTKIIVYIKTFGFYFVFCLFPFRVTFYHNFLQSMAGSLRYKAISIWDKYFWIGLFTMIGIVAYSIHDWNPIAWGLVAFWIGITPFCNVVRANQEIAERFCALPNIFLMFTLAQIIGPYSILCSAFIVFYATRTFWTVDMYKDEYLITEIAVIEDPHAWWAWHCRAMKRFDNKSFREALIFWVIAKTISPKEFKLYMNIGVCMCLMGDKKEGDTYIEKAEQNIIPGQEKEAKDIIKAYREGKMPILL